jgi:hypothetical protein
MNRLLIIAIPVLLLVLPVAAANIQVAAPAAGAAWKIGTVQTVQWTFAGLPQATQVNVILWKGGSKVGKIASLVPIGANGQGSFAWNVGAVLDVPAAGPGQDYSIKVRTADGEIGSVSGTFSLTSGSSLPTVQAPDPGSLHAGAVTLGKKQPAAMPGVSGASVKMLQVTEPQAGAVLSPYGGYAIRWKFVNLPESGVMLSLLRNGQPAGTPAGTLTDPREFLWNLEPQPPDPGSYKVVVETLDKSSRGSSGVFSVSEIGSIEPRYPGQGMMFFNGDHVEVKWERSGNLQAFDLFLVKAGDTNFKRTLGSHVDAKLEKLDVVLDPGEYGQYSILFKIATSDTNLSVQTGTFTIQMGE